MKLSRKFIYPELKAVARNMRRNPTVAEAKLWLFLERRQLGVKFRRQHVIDKFVVDFFCSEKSLVIEVDGDIHDLQRGRDKEREMMLRALGFRILRFTNKEVKHEIPSVIKRIKKEISIP